VSGIIGPALLIFALVRTVEALQDARSERLRSYNNAVVVWRDNGGLAAWESAVSSMSNASLQVRINGSLLSLGRARSTDISLDSWTYSPSSYASTRAAVPRLADYHTDDIEAYDEGLVLWAEDTAAHRSAAASPESWTVQHPETASVFEVPAFACETSRRTTQCSGNSMDCVEEEIVDATRRWLTRLELVASEGEFAAAERRRPPVRSASTRTHGVEAAGRLGGCQGRQPGGGGAAALPRLTPTRGPRAARHRPIASGSLPRRRRGDGVPLRVRAHCGRIAPGCEAVRHHRRRVHFAPTAGTGVVPRRRRASQVW